MNQKHKQLTELQLSAAQEARLNRSAEIEFVYSTLKLEGEEIEKENVERIVSDPGRGETTAAERAALTLLKSLRFVTALARANGKAAELTADLLVTLHDVPGSASGFREGAGDSQKRGLPPPEVLPAMIDNACQWYTAESFTELNPVEQASIVFLRLFELQPFERGAERTALVAASLFTLRSELPPVIIRPEMERAYRNALEEGYRMNTKPMVELIAEALERSLSSMIDEAGSR